MKTFPLILLHGNLAISYQNVQPIINEAKMVHIQAIHLYVHNLPQTTTPANRKKLKQAIASDGRIC